MQHQHIRLIAATHSSYNINNIMATTFDKTINDFYDEHCLTFNQDNKIWLSFQANISKSLSSIDIIDNIDECKATMQCFLKWSLDNGCTWSEYKNIVDSAADFNDFVLAYANESVEAMFVLQIEIEWPTNWFESRHDNELPYIIKDIKLNDASIEDVEWTCEALAPQQGTVITSQTNHLFNPYDSMEQPVKLQHQIVEATNRQLGHMVIYFSHEVDAANKVASLRAYDLIHTGAVKWLKVMVVNNDFDIDRVRYEAFDIDFEQGITVHIAKQHYEKVFGIGKQPQQNDYFYVPVANRMLEITSVQQEKSLGLTTVWYDCKCKTYEHRTDYRDGSTKQIDASIEDLLNVDDLVSTFDEFDKETATKEQVEIAAQNMFVTDTHVDLSMFEATRQFVHNNVQVHDTVIYAGQLPISGGFYDMNGVKNEIAVQYVCKLPENDWSFACLVQLNDKPQTRASFCQVARLGDMMLAINANKAMLINVADRNQIVASKVMLTSNAWNALIVRHQVVDINGVKASQVCLSIAKLTELETFIDVERNVVAFEHVQQTSNVVQLYGMPGFVTHVRLDSDATTSTKMLVMSQVPQKTTLIADDAQQFMQANKQFVGKDSTFYDIAAYDKLLASQVWLYRTGRYNQLQIMNEKHWIDATEKHQSKW